MLCEICYEPITREEIDAGEAIPGREGLVHQACVNDFYRDPVEDDRYDEYDEYEY